MRSVILHTRIDSLVYLHHPGQFWHPDSNSKIATKTKQLIFMEIIHDLAYSLELPQQYKGQNNCTNAYNLDLNTCFYDVSKIKKYFSKVDLFSKYQIHLSI